MRLANVVAQPDDPAVRRARRARNGRSSVAAREELSPGRPCRPPTLALCLAPEAVAALDRASVKACPNEIEDHPGNSEPSQRVLRDRRRRSRPGASPFPGRPAGPLPWPAMRQGAATCIWSVLMISRAASCIRLLRQDRLSPHQASLPTSRRVCAGRYSRQAHRSWLPDPIEPTPRTGLPDMQRAHLQPQCPSYR